MELQWSNSDPTSQTPLLSLDITIVVTPSRYRDAVQFESKQGEFDIVHLDPSFANPAGRLNPTQNVPAPGNWEHLFLRNSIAEGRSCGLTLNLFFSSSRMSIFDSGYMHKSCIHACEYGMTGAFFISALHVYMYTAADDISGGSRRFIYRTAYDNPRFVLPIFC